MRIRKNVDARGEVEVDADRAQLLRHHRGDLEGTEVESSLPTDASGGHSVKGARNRATRPPFLVDADEQRQFTLGALTELLDGRGQRVHLFGILHVAAK